MSEKLGEMSEPELAEYQAGWKPRTQHDILAEREWQRRMMAHEFQLNHILALLNVRWSIVAACIGVIGTLAGAWIGAHLQKGSGKAAAPIVVPAPVNSTHHAPT